MQVTKDIYRLFSIEVAVVLIGTILPFKASASVEKKGAKTYTFDDVNPSPLTLVSDSNSHTIDGIAN